MNRRKDTAEYDMEFDEAGFMQAIEQEIETRSGVNGRLGQAFEVDLENFGNDDGWAIFPSFTLTIYLKSINQEHRQIRTRVHFDDLTFSVRRDQLGPKAETLINNLLVAEGSGVKIVIKVNHDQVIYTLDHTGYTGEDTDDILNI